jgi:hypothetical protein
VIGNLGMDIIIYAHESPKKVHCLENIIIEQQLVKNFLNLFQQSKWIFKATFQKQIIELQFLISATKFVSDC